MSSSLNSEDPATRTVAPASTQVLPVSALIPPSTEISIFLPLDLAILLISDIFGTQSDMNDWPPKPGWTVMTRARSVTSRNGSTLSTGVSGFREIPAFRPLALILSMATMMSPSASQWTVMMSHPASAKASMYLMGSCIIRWASKTMSEHLRTALMMGGPNVMLGTKAPSITSRCAQSAPAFSMRTSSSPSLEKSDESTEGDTLVIYRQYTLFSLIYLLTWMPCSWPAP